MGAETLETVWSFGSDQTNTSSTRKRVNITYNWIHTLALFGVALLSCEAATACSLGREPKEKCSQKTESREAVAG